MDITQMKIIKDAVNNMHRIDDYLMERKSERKSSLTQEKQRENLSRNNTELDVIESDIFPDVISNLSEKIKQNFNLNNNSNDSDNNNEISSLFKTKAAEKKEEKEESSKELISSSSITKDEPLYKNKPENSSNSSVYFNLIEEMNSFFKKYLDNSLTQEDILSFKGFSRERTLLKSISNKKTTTESNILFLKTKGVSKEMIGEFQSLILQAYQGDASNLKNDDFFSFGENVNNSMLDLLKDLKPNSNVLINDVIDITLLDNIIKKYGSVLNFTIKPYTELSKDLSLLSFEGDAVVMGADEIPAPNQYDLAINFIKENNEIDVNTKNLALSSLRKDEKVILSGADSLKDEGVLLNIMPSEINSKHREIFQSNYNKYILTNDIIRLPFYQEKNMSFDMSYGTKSPNSKSFDLEKVKDINGNLLSQNPSKITKKILIPLDTWRVLDYSIDAYEEDPKDFFKKSKKNDVTYNLIDLGEKTNNKSVLPTANNIEDIEFKDGCFYQDNDDFFQYDTDKGKVYLKGIHKERAKHFLEIVNALEHTFKIQKTSDNYSGSLSKLNKSYNLFTEKFGALGDRKNELKLANDYRYRNVSILESTETDKETGETVFIPSNFLNQRTFEIDKTFDNLNLTDLCLITFERLGHFDLDFIEKNSVKPISKEEIKDFLINSQIAYQEGDKLIHRDVYLSGDLTQRIEIAKVLVKQDASYQRNIDAIEKIMPSKIDFEDIYLNIGSHWLHSDIVNDFLNELVGNNSDFSLSKDPINLTWSLSQKDAQSLNNSASFNSKYSTSQRKAANILLSALNNGSVIVTNNAKINPEATQEAKDRVESINHDFIEYIRNNPKHKLNIEKTYNEMFNGYKRIEFNSKSLSFDGMNRNIKLRQHQANAVNLSLNFNNVLYAHDAGSGKSFTQFADAVMKKRRTGKPSMLAVPNHMPEQMIREGLDLFPETKVLFLDNAILKSPEKLKNKLESVDFDVFIIKHDSLTRYLTVPNDFEKELIKEEVNEINSLIDYFKYDKKISSILEKSLEKLNKRLSNIKDDTKIDIDMLNIGSLIVDEAHNFKNLEIQDLSGNMIDKIEGSQRASSLKMITKYLYKRNNGNNGVSFASGTPVSNSLLEIFNIQQYLQPDLSKKLGLNKIKNWADTFLDIKTQYEPDPTGQNYVAKNKYILKNIPELISILSNTMNIVTLEDAGIKVPDSNVIFENCPMDKNQKRISENLVDRLDKIKRKKVSIKKDNMLKVISDSRKMALCSGMVTTDGSTGTPGISPKLEKACQNIFKEYQNSNEILGTQLVFCDLGTPSGFKNGDSIYDVIKNRLIELGMSPSEISFIHDPKNGKEKEVLFDKVREGTVRVLIGSTPKMGEGTNVQKRIVASHDIDATWRSKDIIQRRRRTVRQGNMNSDVNLYVYTTQNSFDAYAWAKLDAKNKAFSHIMNGRSTTRTFEMDLDPSFSETYAIVSGRQELIENAKVESKLIDLNAKKNALLRQKEKLSQESLILQNSQENNIKNISVLEDLKRVNNITGWAIDGKETNRGNVLKQREKSITFNGYSVLFKDKKWFFGNSENDNFIFKRPVDIEKNMDFEIEKRVDALKLSLKEDEKEIQDIESIISTINLNKFDDDIIALESQLNEFNDGEQESIRMG